MVKSLLLNLPLRIDTTYAPTTNATKKKVIEIKEINLVLKLEAILDDYNLRCMIIYFLLPYLNIF